MTKLRENFSKKAALRLAALAGFGLSLSGCVYDYGGDGYYAEGYSADQCDPYSEFDNYYDCDNRHGFVNIGFGGGWYDNYYYPGHGFYLFDSYGSRYNMHDRYRRYWAQQRYHHYQNYSRGGHERGYGRGRGHGYGNGYSHGQGHNGYYGGQGSHHERDNRRRDADVRDDRAQRGNGFLGAVMGNRRRSDEDGRGGGLSNRSQSDSGAAAVQAQNNSYSAARPERSQRVSQPESRPAPVARPQSEGRGLGRAGRSIMGRKNSD